MKHVIFAFVALATTDVVHAQESKAELDALLKNMAKGTSTKISSDEIIGKLTATRSTVKAVGTEEHVKCLMRKSMMQIPMQLLPQGRRYRPSVSTLNPPRIDVLALFARRMQEKSKGQLRGRRTKPKKRKIFAATRIHCHLETRRLAFQVSPAT